MASFKTARLGEDIRRELTDIFRDLKDPRVDPMLSIVKVDLSGDQSSCKVYVSSVSGLERAKESVKGLASGAGYIRRELCQRLKMRRSPELHFIADASIEHGAQIARKLEEIL
ncbi:MAG: 30S ribosome-binding factor RbfA [Angelakisella sp.]|nr:30S ribosome-binding factor RbfA [Angelakisella sp.]